jgi:hypothetical protein
LEWTVKFWDVAEHKERFVIKGLPTQVSALSLTADGRWLAGSLEKEARIWNLADVPNP